MIYGNIKISIGKIEFFKGNFGVKEIGFGLGFLLKILSFDSWLLKGFCEFLICVMEFIKVERDFEVGDEF